MQPIYRSYQQIEQFTADAAHELRTPLAATQATVESALLVDLDPQETKDILNPVQFESWSFIQKSNRLIKRRKNQLDLMLKIDYARWNQSKEQLRTEALAAKHPRTRERLMALYEISEGKSATKVGKQTNRNPQTVMGWVHRYNQEGLGAIEYQRTGGRNPFFPQRYEKI